MAKKTTGKSGGKKTNARARVRSLASIQNDYGSASSAWGMNAFGMPGTPSGAGSYQQVSDTTTVFQNLRWYFISNFRQVLSQLYCEIGLIQRVVDIPVDDALRGGVTIKSKQLSEEQIRVLKDSVDRDDDIATVGQAWKWTRLFGGGGILILVGDQDPGAPLDIEAIGPDTTFQLRAVDMWELFWDKQNAEGYDPEIQAEEFEFYDYYAEKLHKSRVMRLKGLDAPSFVRPRLRGWGFSVVEGVVRALNQYLKTSDLTFEVLDEFKVDYYKIKNLVNTMLGPNAATKVQETAMKMNMQKNYQNAVVMDSEDSWEQKQLSFTGLSDVALQNRRQLAAELGFPVSKLFGSSDSAASLGNADQNDVENYNSMVEHVRNKIKYAILRVIELKCQKLFQYIPDDIELEFKPLRVLSATDEENVKTQKFTRLFQAMQSEYITSNEFRDAANKGALFDVKLDTNADLGLGDADGQDGAEEEPGHDPERDTDAEDPGANREDSRSPKPMTELSSVPGKAVNALRVWNVVRNAKPTQPTIRVWRIEKAA